MLVEALYRIFGCVSVSATAKTATASNFD